MKYLEIILYALSFATICSMKSKNSVDSNIINDKYYEEINNLYCYLRVESYLNMIQK